MNGLAAARDEKDKLCGIFTRLLAKRARMNYKRLDLNGLAPLRLASVRLWRAGKDDRKPENNGTIRS
jgi:hypothetical protein